MVNRKPLQNIIHVIETDENTNRKHHLFDNLARVADALAKQFDPFCEVVIHDLAKPEKSIVHIAGNVTGRRLGGPMTNFVLSLLRQSDHPEDMTGYLARTREGRTLNSSTIFIRDDDDTILGVFCINLDITVLLSASDQINQFALPSSAIEVDKSFSNDVPDLLHQMIQTSLKRVLKTSSLEEYDQSITPELRRTILADLDEQGAFRIRKAIAMIADMFGVSRYTIYKDLKVTNGDLEE